MADKPIIFSAPMIHALLDGRKTQTRRLLKPARGVTLGDFHKKGPHPSGVGTIWECPRDKLVARYAPGDRLWVREAWARLMDYEGADAGTQALCDGRFYRAGHPDGIYSERDPAQSIRWRPSIHMPRWASRITLTVTDVRVQRLQDISEDDARAEGFDAGLMNDAMPPRDIGDGYTISSPGAYASAGGMFLDFWAKLHPDWDGYSDPWVCALTFTVERRNIDAVSSPLRGK